MIHGTGMDTEDCYGMPCAKDAVKNAKCADRRRKKILHANNGTAIA